MIIRIEFVPLDIFKSNCSMNLFENHVKMLKFNIVHMY